MGQVVTTLVIDADTAGAGVFESAMSGAENVAKSTMQAVAGVGKSFGDMTAILGGGAFAAGLALVVSMNKGLADMATTAHQVGLSLTDFQGLQLGGAISGLSADQINSGLEKSAALLNDASRNSNTLSKELEANGISIKNANGQLITENQLLGIAANLVAKAKNPGDELAIAQMLGFTKEWIPLLEQGSSAMSALSAEAKAAGAVVDDATINRASEFDTQWRKSSVEFSAYMKAAMLGLLPYIDDLITRAASFVKSIDTDAIEKAANKQLKMGADALGLPDQAAAKFEMPQSALDNWATFGDEISGVFKSIRDFANDDSSLSMLDKLTGLLTSKPPSFTSVKSKVAGLMPDVQVMPQEDYKWYGGTSSVIDTSDPTIQAGKNTAAWVAEGTAWKTLGADVLAGADAISGGFSKVAKNDVAASAFDHAEQALRKYIETSNAGVASAGQGIAAQEKLKAVAELTAAGLKDKLTPAAAAAKAEMSGLPDIAGAAAVALAKANTAASIAFGRQTSLLSSDDVAIAQQLKGQYASVAESLNSVEAASIRTNTAMKALSSAMETNLTTGLTDIVSGTKSVSQGFSDMGLAVVKAIEQMIIKIAIVTPLMQAMQAAGNSLGILPGTGTVANGGIVLGGPSGPGTFSAHGNMFNGGNVIPFARGGVLDGPSIVPLAMMGEAGPEAIVPLRRGSDGNLGIASSGGGAGSQVNVSVHNYGNDNVSVNQKQNSSGGVDLEVMVGQAAASQMAKKGSALRQVTDNRALLASR